jgi:hypothetical protein
MKIFNLFTQWVRVYYDIFPLRLGPSTPYHIPFIKVKIVNKG